MLHAADHAVILMYHRFGEDTIPSTNIRLEQFDRHLEILASGDYNVWPLGKIVTHLQKKQPLPDRTVGISIDDAYFSVYAEAWPRLKEKGFPFTVDSSDTFDMGEAGGRFSYIEDPDGTWIEFVETHKVPILKKIGWYIHLKKRKPGKALPRFVLKMMGLNRVND